MGCQYAISDQITQKQGNYIFSLKRNHGTLCEDVTPYLSDNELKNIDNISSCKDYDNGHGRLETKMKRQSIKRLRKMAGWNHNILPNILTQQFSCGKPGYNIS